MRERASEGDDHDEGGQEREGRNEGPGIKTKRLRVGPDQNPQSQALKKPGEGWRGTKKRPTR